MTHLVYSLHIISYNLLTVLMLTTKSTTAFESFHWYINFCIFQLDISTAHFMTPLYRSFIFPGGAKTYEPGLYKVDSRFKKCHVFEGSGVI
jgi:hypothetical protein